MRRLKRIILNTPAVISYHICNPETLVSLFHSLNVLQKVFSLTFICKSVAASTFESFDCALSYVDKLGTKLVVLYHFDNNIYNQDALWFRLFFIPLTSYLLVVYLFS